MPNTEWFRDYEKVVALGRWLNEINYFVGSTANVLAFFEKPWKYEDEWAEYLSFREGEEKAAGMTDEEWQSHLASGRA